MRPLRHRKPGPLYTKLRSLLSSAQSPFMAQPVYKRSPIFCVTGLWVWMICRDGFPGFGYLFGSRGLAGRLLPFRAAMAGYRRKFEPTSAYAVLIAAISGPLPMMFMTRLRL